MSTPTPFSSLASKPPQNPSPSSNDYTSPFTSSRPSPLRSPSSNNYAAALADAKLRAAASPTSPGIYKPLGRLGGASTTAAPTPGLTSTTASASTDSPSTAAASANVPFPPSPSTATPTSAPQEKNGKPHTQPTVLTTSTGVPTGTITPPAWMAVDGASEGGDALGDGLPGVERMQSWSEQDMKRVMQERLLRGQGGGFSRG